MKKVQIMTNLVFRFISCLTKIFLFEIYQWLMEIKHRLSNMADYENICEHFLVYSYTWNKYYNLTFLLTKNNLTEHT